MNNMHFISLWFLIKFTVFAQAGTQGLLTVRVEQNAENKQIIFKFKDEVPSFVVNHDKADKQTEITWKDDGKKSYFKEFDYPDLEKGVRRVSISVEPSQKLGSITVLHDPGAEFQLAQERSGVLLLKFGNGASRALSSLPKSSTQEKKITLNVKNTSLAKILRSIAAESDKSLIFGDDVNGNVSANVSNMSYEDTVNNILKATPYRAEHSGNVTIVRAEKTGRSFRTFKARFIDVNQVLKTVQDVISKDGQVSVDTNTNTLFVTDRVDVLHNVEQMFATLDQEPRQVEVEAAIVDLESKNGFDLGFGFTADVNHTGEVFNDINTSKVSPVDSTLAASKGMFVGLSWKSVRGILTALASKSKLSVIAKPRVLALNDQEASILIGSQIGYPTITVTQNGNVQDVKFITVGTQLKIKPHITQTGDMLMYIRPEISDGSLDPNTRLPSTTTTSSETKVLAKDGQTILIGGLMRDRLEKKVDKVPLLGDIPIIGFLFRGTSESMVKSEIVILLSPKIVNAERIVNSQVKAGSIVEKAAKELGITREEAGLGQ